jgi:hypothetical protein
MLKSKLFKIGLFTFLIIAAITYCIIRSNTPAYALPITLDENMTAEWSNGGWIITLKATDPGVKTGTTMSLILTSEWYRDNVLYKSGEVTATLTVGDSEFKKLYKTTAISSSTYIISNGSGSGGADFLNTDGSFKFWVVAKNDGTEYTYTFKLTKK